MPKNRRWFKVFISVCLAHALAHGFGTELRNMLLLKFI
jgi:hypothetical protein